MKPLAFSFSEDAAEEQDDEPSVESNKSERGVSCDYCNRL
jgi:hypothetical protein